MWVVERGELWNPSALKTLCFQKGREGPLRKVFSTAGNTASPVLLGLNMVCITAGNGCLTLSQFLSNPRNHPGLCLQPLKPQLEPPSPSSKLLPRLPNGPPVFFSTLLKSVLGPAARAIIYVENRV